MKVVALNVSKHIHNFCSLYVENSFLESEDIDAKESETSYL